jgi:uncharacterized membrane protein (UPF0182 family)
MMLEWSTFALYWYAPRTNGIVDPIFGRPLNFYLFTLPAWQIITGWLLTLAVIACESLFYLFLLLAVYRRLGDAGAATYRCPGAGFPSHLHFCY